MSKPDPLDRIKELNRQRANRARSATQVVTHHKSEIETRIEQVTQHFPHELRPYQIQGVEFMLTTWVKNSGILQGDDMGLGKTVQAITATLAHHPNTTPHAPFNHVLYLTKPSLIDKTADEWRMWGKHWIDKGELAIIPVHPNPKKDQVELLVSMARTIPGQVVFITNYESLNSFPFLAEHTWDLLIVDEVHKLKGGAQYNQTKIWKNTRNLVWGDQFLSPSGAVNKDVIQAAKLGAIKLKPKVRHYLFMSGTFIVNGSEELWAYLTIFNPWVFDDLNEFKNLLSFTSDGNIEVSQLMEILTPMMVRRRIDEVCEELPKLTHHDHETDPHVCLTRHYPMQGQLYQKLKEDFFAELPNGSSLSVQMLLDQLIRLRQINVHHNELSTVHKVKNSHGEVVDQYPVTVNWDGNEKIDRAMDITLELEENHERVVIFSNFNQPIRDLANKFADMGTPHLVLTGDKRSSGYYHPTSGFKSLPVGDLVELWQNTTFEHGPQVFLINLASGAEGLNLQKSEKWVGGASHVIMMDRWYNNARNNQAVARIYRMDTTLPCHVWWLHTPNSVDDFMLDLCNSKQTIADGVVESDDIRYSKERLQELI